MQLVRLHLSHFRNYETAELTPGPFNLIVGPNAQGKTNLLEAIFFLGTARSHRTPSSEEAIQDRAEQARIYGAVERGSVRREVELLLIRSGPGRPAGGKQVLLDGKAPPRLSALLGVLQVVLFAPESTAIVRGGPAERRRFLDLLASQVRADYLSALQEYTTALRQRNELLKQIRAGSRSETLEAWDLVIARSGAALTRLRAELCAELAPIAAQLHARLTDGKEHLSLVYRPGGVEEEEAFRERLLALRSADLERGVTSLGPHRDEVELRINGSDTRRLASQGQQRTATLALKLAEIRWIHHRTGDLPLVLLDDVTSELDRMRIGILFELLQELPSQVFLTATHLDEETLPRSASPNVFEVRAGIVKPATEPAF